MRETLLEKAVGFAKTAGKSKESRTDRDGFLSYKSEAHALGVGIAAGFFFTANGETKLLSMVYGASVYGKIFGETKSRRRIAGDIKKEPHYALVGAVIGAIIGYASGYTPVDEVMQRLIEVVNYIPTIGVF